MKIQILSTTIIALLLALTVGPVNAQLPASAIARSPDHPDTWVDGATRERQSLLWSPTKNMLFAVVKYSTADYADSAHPTEEEDFSLPLPSVRFDPHSDRFLVKGTVIAALRPGLIGSSVALDPKWTLSVHRHHGAIYAAIVPRTHDY